MWALAFLIHLTEILYESGHAQAHAQDQAHAQAQMGNC